MVIVANVVNPPKKPGMSKCMNSLMFINGMNMTIIMEPIILTNVVGVMVEWLILAFNKSVMYTRHTAPSAAHIMDNIIIINDYSL